MTYKVGTHINLKKQAKRDQIIDDLQNTAFWVIAITLFIWCIFS